ncbi:Alpha/Beta hydrolase protein [Crucibulum laeve]|uniref:Alpha/Beta hydrolase protein n=1 Tax=Crucibulum laeve TaxID=68775 RepID=A0A5C3MAX7_9AGAR|nr:Alpha/Beta hydrolase protein [Crucibulum laeve]
MGALLSVVTLGAMAAFFALGSSNYSDRQPVVHFPTQPAVLAVKKAKDLDEVEHVSLRTLIETRCQSLFTEFHPLWWLFNGHLQTIYCVLGNFAKNDLIWYERTYLRLSDGGTLGLDFSPIKSESSHLKDDSPIVVVQHGLTGGSYEPYVRAILSRACAKKEDGGLGFRAVVINFRGCAGVPITSPLLYSAGHTDDTRQALMYVARQYPNAPLLGLGFSLGSNVLTRYLAEEGAHSRLHSACALACPWDLAANNNGLLTSFLGKHIYSKGMGGNLLNLLRKHLKPLIADPDHHVAKAAQMALSLKNPTLEAFDNTFTRIAGGPAPHFPFANSDDYYRWGSSHNVVKDIAVPYLAINADDDPVVRHVPMDGAGNGLVVMELTRGGGHLGWFQAGLGFVDRWTTKPVLEWLKLVGEELVHDPNPKGRPLFVDTDGYLKEEGKPHLGCRVIDGGGIIDGSGGEEGMLQGL